MSIKKRLMAAFLIVSMVLCMAVPAFAAAKSGSTAPETTNANKTFVVKTNMDNNQQDHNKQAIVRTEVLSNSATVQSVLHGKDKKPASFVALTTARDKDNKKHLITQVGNGKIGVFDSKKGRCVKSVTIGSTKKVTVAPNAFKNSSVNILRLKSKMVFKANAFKGTNNAAMKIYVIAPKKTAADFSFASGAFTGLSDKAVFTVTADAMTAAEFNKLKSKLVKAGFKGKIVRK